MIRIAVCDDEEFVCTALENHINNSCESLHIDAEVDLFSSGVSLKKHLSEETLYNIFFLDIELTDDTGIGISNYIRNEMNDESAQIIYVSGKNEYDRQLFAFRPFAFIEKPFDEISIRTVIEKYMRIYGNENNIFHYKYGHDTFWVNISSILYFKSNRRKVKIITMNAEDEFYGSLEDIYNKLKNCNYSVPLLKYRFRST